MNTYDFEKANAHREVSPLYFVYRWGVIAPFLALSTFTLGSIIIILCMFGFANFASRVLGRS